jgi:hypothetical protein
MGAGGVSRGAEPVRLSVLTTTHALFAMKVQCKVRNGVADLVAADQSGSVPNLSDAAGKRARENACSQHQARAACLGAAAQTRTVSGGHFLPSKTSVITSSQVHSSNSVQTLIFEFESYDPSHAVGLCGAMTER